MSNIYSHEIREYFNSHFVQNKEKKIFPLLKGSGNDSILDKTCMKLFLNYNQNMIVRHLHIILLFVNLIPDVSLKIN